MIRPAALIDSRRWEARPSRLWIGACAPLRRWRLRRLGVRSIEVHGREHVRRALSRGEALIVAANHPSYADPHCLFEALPHGPHPWIWLTASELFSELGRLGRRALQRHGCMSVERDGANAVALREALGHVLAGRPLALFPEGYVHHTPNQPARFDPGAARLALLSARRAGVAWLAPCAIRYEHDAASSLGARRVVEDCERRLGLESSAGGLFSRLRRIREAHLERLERDHGCEPRSGDAAQRAARLADDLCERVERELRLDGPASASIHWSERLAQLRRRVRDPEFTLDALARAAALEQLHLAHGLRSWAFDALEGHDDLERAAAAIAQLEEELLQRPRARGIGPRRAVVCFGPAFEVRPHDDLSATVARLEQRVVELLREPVSRAAEAGDVPRSPRGLEFERIGHGRVRFGMRED